MILVATVLAFAVLVVALALGLRVARAIQDGRDRRRRIAKAWTADEVARVYDFEAARRRRRERLQARAAAASVRFPPTPHRRRSGTWAR